MCSSQCSTRVSFTRDRVLSSASLLLVLAGVGDPTVMLDGRSHGDNG